MSPGSVQSALREVRPDDLDAIFDDALFGAPTPEAAVAEAPADSEGAAPVSVGSVEWYMERDAQPAGPFRLERLRELWHHGELGPDTLLWCEAWPNWRPLSRVPELVAALTDAGLPMVAADSVPAASARVKEAEEEMVSALPSLVAEEEAWMEKMQEEREQAKEEERAALLNAPSAPMPVTPPVVAPPIVPVLVAPEAPEAPVPSRPGRALLVGAVMGGAAVALVAGALLLLPRVQFVPEQVSEAPPRPVATTRETPRQEAPATVAVTPPTPPPVQAPAPESPRPAAPVVAAAPAVRPVAPAPPPPVTPVAEKQEPRVATVAARPVEKKEAEASGRRLATVRREESRALEEERLTRAAESALQRRSQPPPAAPAKVEGHKALEDDAPAKDPTNFDDSLDKEFERELGFDEDSPKNKPVDPRSKRTVYLPPEPGKELPESLSDSDVMQVVGSHKDGIVSCIEEHAPPAPESGKGRFVVRWRVQPSGTASDIRMETEALEGTPFARCIEGQVRSWKFPRHRVQRREPVRFPFTY